ncbi:MAG TPA: TRAP transporter fused permease subunit [Burkholderiaceae bacterium]|nr:TRAP transporter fused permease subunit [Burkholderiaceae bacterium]
MLTVQDSRTTSVRAGLRRHANLANLTFALALVFFVWLIWYFYTGFGGPSELATRLVPMALLLQILFMQQQDGLYKRLPAGANYVLVAAYAAICVYAFVYFLIDYENIAIWRQGSYTRQDFIVGLLVFLLVMELSRLAHPILFWVNVVLVVFTLYGYLSPIDFFWHPGTTFYRVVTSSTVELATGIYGLYAQLALTLIAAFLLLAAVARGFGAQGAMVNVMRRLAGRSRHTVPQTAILASVSVGLVSGSGSANTAVTGSFTIPLMKRYGVPAPFAGAVETAASMGGLVMPPLMAVAGFLMAEFLGVPYWEVVKRGFAIAFVYFVALSLSVYLLSVRLLPPQPVAVPAVPAHDRVKTAIFFLSIVYLIVLMGWAGTGALRAALYAAIFMFGFLVLAFLYFKHVRRDAGVAAESLLGNLRTTIETHAEMASYLTLLLATLGIMIGLFTVTGFINRMGGMLLQLGEWHIIALILMAWVFGWLVGAGLPPTATYIILAVITVEPMRKLGIDPWVAHFFAFLMAIWGELSPPTSLTAAVAARIADASFMRTMWEAVKLCLPITFMSFAIFTRSDMVMNPGWPQLVDTVLVAIATCGVTAAIFGRLVAVRGADILLRAALALAALFVMFHPDGQVAAAAAALVLPATVITVWRHRQVAPPKGEIAAPFVQEQKLAP